MLLKKEELGSRRLDFIKDLAPDPYPQMIAGWKKQFSQAQTFLEVGAKYFCKKPL
jgi:hypothetical protein